MAPREASIEKYLVDRAAAAGGIAIKLDPSNRVGIPDRMVILPGGVVGFFEVKRPKGGTVDGVQQVWHMYLTDMGHPAFITPTREAVDNALSSLRQDRDRR